jgi:MoaA/NifB/PqqE/SkfB family radical SAM enzyme
MNIMEMWLFDTCNFRCGYCGLVESGAVKETDQLTPFRDEAYIRKLVRFFSDNRPGGRPWMVQLTGGEPFLMPNLDLFCKELAGQGDKVAIYSNGSIPVEPVLANLDVSVFSYIQLSFHPDWHVGTFSADKFFAGAQKLKELGVPCLVRFVGVPQMLHLLPGLAQKCKELGIGFLPTTLFDPKYPNAYTKGEKEYLAGFMSGYSSLLQLDGGVLVSAGRRCTAADRLYAVRLNQGGDITPCISTGRPILGNIFENKLRTIPGMKACFKPDNVCSCDVHFQQNVVEGIDDSEDFAAILRGETRQRAKQYPEWLARNEIVINENHWVGQGTIAYEIQGLVVKNEKR